MKKQTGFTLIELITVIVIIGILAAFAVPRFTDLSREAKVAALNKMAGTLRSAAMLQKPRGWPMEKKQPTRKWV